MNPFEFVNDITNGKSNIMVDDITEKAYNPYMVNRSLSYFHDCVLMANEMNIGDVIHANTSTGGTPEYGIFCVNSNSGTVVDVADMVSLSGTDTD